MIKLKTVLEHVAGERVYHMLFDNSAPIGEIFDALCKWKAMVGQKIVDDSKSESAANQPPVTEEKPS